MSNVVFDFKGNNVIVTGGTRGIGLAITEAFLKAGASVTAIFAKDSDSALRMRDKWKGFPLETRRLDVSDYSEAEKFFKEFNETHPSLETLVNCAGIRKDNIVGMMSFEEWTRVMDVNITGTFNMSKFALIKMMENRFGRIINVTSPSGKFGFAGQANYAASKAAQVAFSKSLAKEAARRGITVNCISPGFIDTELISDLPEEQKKAYKEQIPLRRFGSTKEAADATLFLASREASYITGSVFEVTGGF
jgi:3-oxoacyl-[acyl-carrier protein] reductase